jgi:hypothetical protein
MMTDQARARGAPGRLLLDLAAERLEPDEVAALELWLRREGLESAPPWLVRRAERLAGRVAARPSGSRALGAARRLIGRLVFDSQCQPQFVGLRSARTQVRRLLFQADNLEVDLEMSPQASNNSYRLAGQVTASGSEPAGGFVRLSTETGEWAADLDVDGEFWLDDLAPGAYRLEVVLGGQVLEVPRLPI